MNYQVKRWVSKKYPIQKTVTILLLYGIRRYFLHRVINRNCGKKVFSIAATALHELGHASGYVSRLNVAARRGEISHPDRDAIIAVGNEEKAPPEASGALRKVTPRRSQSRGDGKSISVWLRACVFAGRRIGEHSVDRHVLKLALRILVEAADANVADALTVQTVMRQVWGTA